MTLLIIVEDFLAQPKEDDLVYPSSASETSDDSEVGLENGAQLDMRSQILQNRWQNSSHDVSGSHDNDKSDDDSVGNWGLPTSTYYDADKVETEQEALDEEAEALKIQKKRLGTLDKQDFGFDKDTWAADSASPTGSGSGDFEDGAVLAEKLPQVRVTAKMSDMEKQGLLFRRYPELKQWAAELQNLRPLWIQLSSTIGMPCNMTKNEEKVHLKASIQFRALSAYLGSLAIYFAMLSSTADQNDGRSGEDTYLALAPSELRSHEMTENLMRCRQIWARVKDMALPIEDFESSEESRLDEEVGVEAEEIEPDAMVDINTNTSPTHAQRIPDLGRIEKSLSNLDKEIAEVTRASRRASHLPKSQNDYDLGDEADSSEQNLAEKERKRKSLRFYASQVAQKAAKRENAAIVRNAQGDDDLPYSKRLPSNGMKPNDEKKLRHDDKASGGNAIRTANDSRARIGGAENLDSNRVIAHEDDDPNGQQMLQRAYAKKEAKRARDAVYAKARATGGKVIPSEQAQDQKIEGRRDIGFTIAKNKGLTPNRRKEVKNPRVKKRKRFESKSKKIKSMKPTWQGGESRGGYEGELTGIKSGLVKSTKL